MRKFIVVAGNNQGVIKRALLKRGNWEDVTEDKDDGNLNGVHFVWKPNNLSIRAYALLDSNPPHPDFVQVINHFENNRGICTKTGLIRSLRSYYHQTEQANSCRYTLFESTPTTFLITAGDENQEYVNFMTKFKDIAKKQFSKSHIPEKHCQENLWLIKPANMNQGRGIEIFKNFKDIQSFFNSQQVNSYWVAQKYIEKPLLYYGRKFDIRVWVLVTAKLEIFFFKTPYMRTSSDNYATDAMDNYIHLTNNCLQKHGDNFGKFEAGNTLPLSALQTYLDENFPQHGLSVEKNLVPRMKDMIIDTILSVKKALNPKRRKNIFELFGYDFLIDEDYRTWLLEVNTNPYLGVPNDFIKNLLPQMVDDMMKIVVDPHYPPTNADCLSPRENGFELIYCEYHSAYNNGPKNVRAPFHENIYPIPSIAPTLRHVKIGAPVKFESNHSRNTIKDYSSTNHETNSNSLSISLKMTSSEKDAMVESSKNELSLSLKTMKSLKKPTNLNLAAAENMIDSQGPQGQTTPMSQRGDVKRRSVIVVSEKQANPVNMNGVTETARKVDHLLESYSVIDYEHFMPLISKLLSVLTNWELQSDKEISTACKSIITLSESRMCGAVAEPVNITQMISLIDSQNVPLKIQMTMVTAFLDICKKISEMKKIICDKMIHALIKITLASCDAALIQNYDVEIIKLAIQCLSALSGKYDRKMYIPGETRDYDKVREFLINQGGILALMVASKLSVDEEVKDMPNKGCFFYLSVSDWELQKSILERIKEGKLNFLALEDDSNPVSVKGRANVGFLFPVSTSNVMKSENNTKRGGSDAPVQAVPNIPKYLLEMKGYSLEDMITDVEEKITALKESKRKREQEEEEKREQALNDLAKEQQQKEILMQEKRKKAEEVFLRRLEDKRKVQDELLKKNEEEVKERVFREEERKKAKLQELQKKKEEYEKKAKKFEIKKKKQEDEMKKVIEEEIEKKKAQRKALEESFWTRVKAKGKEKQTDKLPNRFEDVKRPNILLISNERTSSVEPTRTRDETPDSKPRMLRTHTSNTPQHNIENEKASTFSSFFKDEAAQYGVSPARSLKKKKSLNTKDQRQKSVEEMRTKKREKDEYASVNLPYIDGGGFKNGRTMNERTIKALKPSSLFTLNEANAEEEANTYTDENGMPSPLARRVVRESNLLRPEQDKIKRMTSSDNYKQKNSGVREVVLEKFKDKEREKVKDLIKQSPYGQVLRHNNSQDVDGLMQSGTLKIYVQGTRRRARIQPGAIKN